MRGYFSRESTLPENADSKALNIFHVCEGNPDDPAILMIHGYPTSSYDYADLDEVVLAYAVSVHKSQGSEYPVVIMPVLTQHYVLLQRNLIYTGVTRGRKLVVIVGTRKALAIGIKNDKTQKRYTYLTQRLRF